MFLRRVFHKAIFTLFWVNTGSFSKILIIFLVYFAYRSQKRVSTPPGTEVILASHHVGAGIQTPSSVNSQCCSPLSLLSSSYCDVWRPGCLHWSLPPLPPEVHTASPGLVAMFHWGESYACRNAFLDFTVQFLLILSRLNIFLLVISKIKTFFFFFFKK